MKNKFLIHIFWWIGAMFLYRLLRAGNKEDILVLDIPPFYIFLVFLSASIGLGIMTYVNTRLFEKEVFARMPLGKHLVIKALVNFLGLLVFANMIQVTFLFIRGILGTVEKVTIITAPEFWVFVLYFFISSSLFSFFGMLIQKIGRKTFLNLLLGKYRTPREEQQIFMFLDLKGSTTLAEQLGHIQYSKLIQMCFIDLNVVVEQHKGEIYQYVGDEAVIYWDFNNEESVHRCINCFNAFQKRLTEQASNYQSMFGLVPEFKAGIHGGNIIATEVGIVKREIAFHGDTINTAARIQGACNAYEQSLLISETVFKHLQKAETANLHYVGDALLKGKEIPVGMYGFKPSA